MKATTSLRAALATVVLLACASAASAQAPQNKLFLAPYAGYNVDGTEALLGAAVGVPLKVGTTQLYLTPGLEVYPFLTNASAFTINVDVHYPITITGSSFRPYVGGGILLNRTRVETFGTTVTDTNSQISAIGGVDVGQGPFRPFAEANLRFIDGSTLVLKGGGRIFLGK